MPFVHDHVSLMPDGHVGMGATVGSVIPTEGAVMPAAVGVDLGCGMIATETYYTEDMLPDNLDALLPKIAKAVPAGVGVGHGEVNKAFWDTSMAIPGRFNDKQVKTALEQFGSLGSGNHFVEICVDERGIVWTVLHSGSRGIGNQLATMHINTAKKDMKGRFISLEDPDLAYVVEGTPEFEAYIRDMNWAQTYAWNNRQAMNDALQVIVQNALHPSSWARFHNVHVVQTINCHHNYTVKETYDGKSLWITRKGAIDAHGGVMGVIPGSMGTDTYIVRGRGSKASWNSSSHGAGRKMSRGQAKRELSVLDFQDQMASRGVSWQVNDARSLLDESPEAYKDIKTVMEDQKDLSEVVHRLQQRLNYKGM